MNVTSIKKASYGLLTLMVISCQTTTPPKDIATFADSLTLSDSLINTINIEEVPKVFIDKENRIYKDSTAGFEFTYPENAAVDSNRMEFPIQEKTNLQRHYLTINSANTPCSLKDDSSNYSLTSIENITINGYSFIKEEYGDAAAGHYYTGTNYLIFYKGRCLRWEFIIESVNPNVVEPPVKEYKAILEKKKMEAVMASVKLF